MLVHPAISDVYRGQTGILNDSNGPSAGQQGVVGTVVNQDHKPHVTGTAAGQRCVLRGVTDNFKIPESGWFFFFFLIFYQVCDWALALLA